MGAVIERVFKVGERGSTLGCEVMAGVTTFLTMAYIVAVNPTMLQAAGIPFNAALTATCFGAALMTAAMGLIANRPIALASGMGINAVVSYTLCGSMGVDWRVAMGVMMAIGRQGGFADGDGNVANAREILLVDSAAAAIGGFMGASSITSFTESASGVAAGGRTGLSNLVVALAFFACAFLAPIVGMVSSAATCGALVIVGYLMMRDVVNIDWESFEAAIPAFITIIGIPFTYSIANGIGLGFISYVVVMVAQGRAREIHPLMWAVSIVFLITFAAFS